MSSSQRPQRLRSKLWLRALCSFALCLLLSASNVTLQGGQGWSPAMFRSTQSCLGAYKGGYELLEEQGEGSAAQHVRSPSLRFGVEPSPRSKPGTSNHR